MDDSIREAFRDMILFSAFLLIMFMIIAIGVSGLYMFHDGFYCSQQTFNTTSVWERCKDVFTK